MGVKAASTNQMGLAGFSEENVVKLDGGKRLRLDDKVDFWPATQNWQTVQDGPNGPASGVGVSSMLAYLKRAREAEGRPVAMPVPLLSDRHVVCNYCGKPAELHEGKAVYPDRKDLSDRQFWVCWSCDAWVGCHRNSDRPFGALANEELRAARISAHAAFDPIWEDERMTRSEAYDWLAKALGMPRQDCHIGLMKLEDCRRVSQVIWDHFGAPESW